jgi:AcrR family transcriptional regulator
MARTRSDIAPRIVDAARARFLAEGVDGASLRAIAEDAGTSIGMVYYYFKTKDDLFFAVVEETYERLLDDLRRACEPTLPPVERMRRIYRRIGAVSDHESQIVRLVMREVLVSSKRLDRLLARFQRGHFPLVLAIIADGMRDGSIRSDVSPILLLPIAIAVGAIPQFLLNHIAPNLPGPRGDALSDALIDLLWHGISARPAAPPPPRPRPRRSRRRAPAARRAR